MRRRPAGSLDMRRSRAPGYLACIDAASPDVVGVGAGPLFAGSISPSYNRTLGYPPLTRSHGVVRPDAGLRVGAPGFSGYARGGAGRRDILPLLLPLRHTLSGLIFENVSARGPFPPPNNKTLGYFRLAGGSVVSRPFASLRIGALGVH